MPLAVLGACLLLASCVIVAARAMRARSSSNSAIAPRAAPSLAPRATPSLAPPGAPSVAPPGARSVAPPARPSLVPTHAPVEPPPEADETAIPRAESRVAVCYEPDADEEEATSPHARILISAKGDTDCGLTRRVNDDSLLMMPECWLFAVADGVGGYAGGQVASSLAVETMKQTFEHQSFVGELIADKPLPTRGRELASSIQQSNWAVLDAARSNPAHSRMGTTLVAARFSPNKQRVYIGHVGDSRCYRLRDGILQQLTTDQTMGLVGLRGPRANELLQAIGVTANLSIDLIVDKPHANDVYLLCSDGLSKMASDQEIQAILSTDLEIEAAVYGLIELAKERGGKDNVTVVLIKVVEQPGKVVLPVPSQDLKAKGWTKLPDAAVLDSYGSDDVTVVGRMELEERTTLGALPTSGQALRAARVPRS